MAFLGEDEARFDALQIHADLVADEDAPLAISHGNLCEAIAPGEQAEGEYIALVGCAGQLRPAEGQFAGDLVEVKHVAFDQGAKPNGMFGELVDDALCRLIVRPGV